MVLLYDVHLATMVVVKESVYMGAFYSGTSTISSLICYFIQEEDITLSGGCASKLVTADGTYASQSAFSAQPSAKPSEERYHAVLLSYINCMVLCSLDPDSICKL